MAHHKTVTTVGKAINKHRVARHGFIATGVVAYSFIYLDGSFISLKHSVDACQTSHEPFR